MCIADDKIPKWNGVASGTINALPFAMTLGFTNPTGK
jgi:hypothetical protein